MDRDTFAAEFGSSAESQVVSCCVNAMSKGFGRKGRFQTETDATIPGLNSNVASSTEVPARGFLLPNYLAGQSSEYGAAESAHRFKKDCLTLFAKSVALAMASTMLPAVIMKGMCARSHRGGSIVTIGRVHAIASPGSLKTWTIYRRQIKP